MKLTILFMFFGPVFASENRRQKSLISNSIEKCFVNEKFINLNFVSDNYSSDETLHLLLDNFINNSDIFFSFAR